MLTPAVLAAVANVREDYPFATQPFFRALADGSLGKDDFLATQIQFLSAVVFFSRPMTALAARLPSADSRVVLLRNVLDEHGGDNLALSHESTFLQLLARLGVSAPTLNTRATGPAVRTFNLTLWSVCAWDHPHFALACLGMIEDLFASISAYLGDQIVANGWLHADELVHYTTHAKLDLHHANDLFALLNTPFHQSAEQAQSIRDGLRLGAHIFLQLYQGLYDARAQRATRQVAAASSLADGWVPHQQITAP